MEAIQIAEMKLLEIENMIHEMKNMQMERITE